MARMGAECVSIETVEKYLKDYGMEIGYNQLTQEVEISGLPFMYSSQNAANILPTYLGDYMRMSGVAGVTRQSVADCLACIADKYRFNPLKTYFKAIAWDGKDRLADIYDILDVASVNHQTYIRKWLIQCVALGLNEEEEPISADGVLVLQGPQGIAKTSFFRKIVPHRKWFVEGATIDMGSKDSKITAIKSWITELGELDSTLRKEQASLKAFITMPEDRIRMPYAHKDSITPRRTSFCGTVNQEDYLKDETGSRRFWTVPLVHIDKERLFGLSSEWVSQLWGQVYALYKDNPSGFRLSDFELKQVQEENRHFEQPLPYELEIEALLNPALPFNRWEWWSAADIARYLSGFPDARKVGKALARVTNRLSATSYQFTNASPNSPILRRKHRGTPQYLLPKVQNGGFRGLAGGMNSAN